MRGSPSVYCDSLHVHTDLIRRGLESASPVLTSSPSLILSGDPRFLDRTAAIDVEVVRELVKRTGPASLAVKSNIAANPDIARFALAAAHAAVSATKLIMQALTIKERDLQEPVVWGRISTGNRLVDERYNAPLGELLQVNPNLTTFDTPITVEKVQSSAMQVNAGFATRLRYLPWSNYELRAWMALWRVFPAKLGRGTYLLARDNQLLRDTARSLARAFYSISGIDAARPPPLQISDRQAALLSDAVRKPLEQLLPDSLGQALRPVTLAAMQQRVAAAAGQYDSSLATWQAAIAEKRPMRPRGLLTNMLAGPHLTALYDACRDQDIPVFSFQHGHARELNQTLAAYGAVLEEAATDVMFTFDDEAAIATEENPFSVAKAESVGLPLDYVRAGRFRRRNADTPSITYVSTAAMTSHRLLPGTCVWSDVRKAEFEILVVNEVLAKLPHDVLYKPYPSSGYIDRSPIEIAANKADNITYFAGNYDLRYLLPDAQVIVTSRCTSTLGWCLAPGVPVVFVDLPDQLPPTAGLLGALQEGIFYVDASADDWIAETVRFLSQPISSIYVEWEKKRRKRNKMLTQYFGIRDQHAGARAATHIVTYVSSRATRSLTSGLQQR